MWRRPLHSRTYALRLRDVGSVSVPRLVVTAFACALIPVAAWLPALLTLAVLAALLSALTAFETLSSRELRREMRAH